MVCLQRVVAITCAVLTTCGGVVKCGVLATCGGVTLCDPRATCAGPRFPTEASPTQAGVEPPPMGRVRVRGHAAVPLAQHVRAVARLLQLPRDRRHLDRDPGAFPCFEGHRLVKFWCGLFNQVQFWPAYERR